MKNIIAIDITNMQHVKIEELKAYLIEANIAWDKLIIEKTEILYKKEG